MATAFAVAGYHTAYVGKWHLDGTNDLDHYVPPERRGGFRYWMGNEASNNQHEHWVYGTGRERPWRLQGYVTDAFSDLLIEHLRDHVGGDGEEYQPFFAVLSVQPPHGPTVTPTNPPYAANSLPRGAGRKRLPRGTRAWPMATGPAGGHCAAACSTPGG